MSFLSKDAGPPHDEVGEEHDPQDTHPQRQWPELAPELALKYHEVEKTGRITESVKEGGGGGGGESHLPVTLECVVFFFDTYFFARFP